MPYRFTHRGAIHYHCEVHQSDSYHNVLDSGDCASCGAKWIKQQQ